MKRVILAIAVLLVYLMPQLASAQSLSILPSGCNTGSYINGVPYLTLNPTGQLCVNASVTASVSGFQPSASGARGTPVTVTTSDSSGTAPTGAVVLVSNVGATNGMYCNANGIAATSSDQFISANGGWFAFTMPSGVTTIHCIGSGGSTTANMVGGSGLPTGTGGGSGSGGGGGGGTVTQGPTGTNAAAWWTQIGDTTHGPVAVKAASTAPVATDPALVTTLSPNTAEVGTPATGVTQPAGGVGLSGWLSGIYKALTGTLTVSVSNANSNGQATMANSSPVTIASDQAGTCTLHAFKHITSATDTLAVQGVSAETVRLCAWKARAAGTATWFWENTASVNANCSSSNTQISGVATEAANTGEVVTLPLGITLNNTSANGLCINSTGTGGVDIDFWYAQR